MASTTRPIHDTTCTVYFLDRIIHGRFTGIESSGGYNTTHNVNNLIMSNGEFNEVDYVRPPKSKRCCRPLNVDKIEDNDLTYVTGARIGPEK